MAKAKTSTVPTIKPNSSLMSWLNQESQAAGNTATTETASETVVAPEKGTKPEVASGNDVLLKPEDVKTEQPPFSELGNPETSGTDAVNKTDDDTHQATPSVRSPSTPVSKKGKSKMAEGKSYPDIFFKKPVKEDGNSADELRVVRVSEDSHWLLSVLVEAARRQGNKLTGGDLIENLLTNHREVHKEVVDELINQWKTRRRIG